MSSTNGHDDPKIKRFPTTEQRKELERLKAANDSAKHEPIFNLPTATKWLCLATILPFAVMQFMPDDLANMILWDGSFVPARYSGGIPFDWTAVTSPITHIFLHGSWMHVLLNTGMLMAFGAGLEKLIGWKKFFVLFFLTGILGAFAHFALNPFQQTPMIGASGAVSGLFGAILMLMHERGAMGGGYKKLVPFIALWIVMSIFFGFFGVPGNDNPIAWATHVGGFIAGLALYRPVMRWV